jgi:hypothetical protein
MIDVILIQRHAPAYLAFVPFIRDFLVQALFEQQLPVFFRQRRSKSAFAINLVRVLGSR